jgi:hypothetical protein
MNRSSFFRGLLAVPLIAPIAKFIPKPTCQRRANCIPCMIETWHKKYNSNPAEFLNHRSFRLVSKSYNTFCSADSMNRFTSFASKSGFRLESFNQHTTPFPGFDGEPLLSAVYVRA